MLQNEHYHDPDREPDPMADLRVDRTVTSTSSTGRPRAFDEDVALDQALEIFWRYGYQAATTRTLEDGLGLSQSSLYNAFGSKRQLFEAALDRYEAQTAVALVEPLESSIDGLDAIARFFDGLAQWVTHEGRGGCLIINLMAADGGEDDAISRRTAAYRARVRHALQGALHRAERRGEIGSGAVEGWTGLLFGQVLAINVAARGSALDEVDRLLAGVNQLLASGRT